MRNRVGKTQTKGNAWKKEKIPSFFPSLPPFFFLFSRKLPSTRKKNTKVESLRGRPFSRKKSLRQCRTCRWRTLPRRRVPSKFSRGCRFLNIATFVFVSNARILFPKKQGLFPTFLSLSLLFSIELQVGQNVVSKKEETFLASVFDTDVTALRSQAHILTVTEFSAVLDLRRL